MPKRITPLEIQTWLERYDAGESIPAIAKASKKDSRIVRKRVEVALRQRDVQAAERRLVENALARHQEDLMGVVNEFANSLTVAAFQGYLAVGLEDARVGTLGLELPSATRGASGYESVHLQVEDRRTWALLQAHLRGDKLWARLDQWRRAYLAGLNFGLRLLEAIRQRSEEETALKVLSEPNSEPCLYPLYPWLLYQSVVPRWPTVTEPLLEAQAVTIGPSGTLRYDRAGYSLTLARVPGVEQEVRDSLFALLKELPQWPEAMGFVEARQKAETRRQEVSRTLEEIQLMHYISGQCEVCRRLGV